MNWRRYHRWLSLPFGLVLLWVALTGVAMQAVEIYDKGLFGDDDDRPAQVTAARVHDPDEDEQAAKPAKPAAIAAAHPLAASAPAPTTPALPRPPQSKAHQLHELLQHLHSGEWFGPFGTIIQTLAGIAMTFFAVSGMWMYVTMFRRRGHKHHDGKKLFW